VADLVRLRQIILNLAGNAIKFTERGELSLTVDLESAVPGAAELHSVLRGTGFSILPEHKETIFAGTRHFQLSGQTHTPARLAANHLAGSRNGGGGVEQIHRARSCGTG